MTFINFNLSSTNSLKCVSINNGECKIRTEIINLNTNEPMLYSYSIKINRCKGSCNKINDPYAKIYVPEQIKLSTFIKKMMLYKTHNQVIGRVILV